MAGNADIVRVAFRLPPEKAVEYLRGKGWAMGYDWTDVWQEAHARAFTVAKAMRLDILEGIRQMVDRAVAEGITLDKFQRSLEPYLKLAGWWGRAWPQDAEGRLIGPGGEPFPTGPDGEPMIPGDARPPMLGSPHRLRTIYRTNMQSALNAGRHARMMEVAERRPYWQYSNPGDERTTSLCASLNGKVFRYDDPIWQTMYPPNHWGCRSRVSSLSEREMQRDGLEAESSEGRMGEAEAVVNTRTGETRTVSTIKIGGSVFRTAPGFSYNPGRVAWQPNLDHYTPEHAALFVASTLGGEPFKRFLGGGVGGDVPVAILGEDMKDLIGANTQSVLLSQETITKQLEEHPEMTVDEYQLLPDIIGDPDIVIMEGDDTLLFTRAVGRWYHAATRRTKSGAAVYLRSFRRTDEKDVLRLSKRGKVVKRRGK